MIEILACPAPVSIQDGGRPGYRHLGVPLSGALDPEWLAIANALAGNPLTCAGLEMRLAGPRLQTDLSLTFAVAGDCEIRIEDIHGQRRQVPSWCSHHLAAGEILIVGRVKSGIAYLALAGGLELPSVLGSRSTYARAGFGGLHGRVLAGGDCLKVGAGDTPNPRYLPHPPGATDQPLRVMSGPQREHFTLAAWEQLISEGFTVSREADRMGLRLDGPTLEHDPAYGADIVSDAVTPGVIQVPGDGHPIVLLADCQTVGGYPKIATVISADLPRLGHALPGQTLRFVEVDIEQALAARRDAVAALAEQLAAIVPGTDGFDLDALYASNLIDGVINAD